jgi:putative copper resistance protein D
VLNPIRLLATLPPLGAHQLLDRQVAVVPTVLIVAAGVLYGVGMVRHDQRHPRHRWSRWRAAAWYGGLLCTLAAVDSFIGVYDRELFWDHMVQHLMLVMVASALFAMGSPLALAFRSTTGRAHQRVATFLRSGVARFFANPLVAFVVYAVLIPLTHLSSFYNLTILHPWIDELDHLLFVFFGYLFWRQVFGIEPNQYRMHPALQMGYLFLAVPVDTFTGLSLNNAVHEMFPAFTAMHRTWGPSLLLDLHGGGVIMWVGGDSLMMLAMIPVAIRWMGYEERQARRVDRELDLASIGMAVRPARWSAFRPSAVGLGRDTPLPDAPRPEVPRGPGTVSDR